MKTKFSKVVSLFMSAIMTVSALTLPGFSANAETNESTEQTINTNDSEIQYGGLFGSMLSDEIGESVENSLEAASEDYAVYELFHDPQTNYIGVDYHAKNDCTLFVGFYNDEGTELITSVKKDLKSEDRGFAEMYVNDVLPENYLIKAFIIGSELINPLSQPCVYNKCTKQMKEILSKTTANFDEENIVNLDENEDNNFLVLQDDVINITSTENSDIYIGEDENENYVFENAVEIAKLQKGNKVFVNTSSEKIAFTVDNIEINESKAVISYTIEEMDSYIKFLKFNSVEYTGEKYIDNSESYADAEERKQLPQPFSPQADSDDPFALQFPTIKSEFDVKISKEFCYKDTLELKAEEKDTKNNIAVKAFGSVTYIFSSKLEIYYEPHIFSDDYISVNFNASIEIMANVGLSFKKTFPIGTKILLFTFEGIVNVFFNPTFTINATGQAYINFKKEFSASADSVNGISCFSFDPVLITLDGNIRIDFLVNSAIDINLLGVTILSVAKSDGIRAKIKSDDPIYLYSGTGKIKSNDFYEIIPKSPDEYIHHDCNSCVNVEISKIKQISCTFGFILFGTNESGIGISRTITLPLTEKPALTFHLNEDGIGSDECENYSHKISFTVTSEKGNKPINNVQFYISSKNQSEKLVTWDDGHELSTYGKGQAEFYVKDSLLTDKTCRIKAVASTGEYAICNVGALFDKDEKGEYNFKVKIDLEDEESLTDDDKDDDKNDTEEDNDDDDDEEVGIIIGVCGVEGVEPNDNVIFKKDANGNVIPTVFFVIYPDENNLDADNPYQDVCYIFGNGVINQSYNIPDWVKKVVVIDQKTKLCCQGDFSGRAFESIDISAMNITEIPSNTFGGCNNLSEVILPPTLEKICHSAFYYCTSLEHIDLPDSVKNICSYAFYITALRSFTAPSDLKDIGFCAFRSCFNLQEVHLNYGLEYIASEAFRATPLKTINFPSTIKELGHAVLSYDNDNIKTVIINSDFDLVRTLTDYEYNDKNEYEKTDSIFDGGGFFSGCSNINNVVFGEGVTFIRNSLCYNRKTIKNISLPSTLKRIGEHSFAYTGLDSVTLPEGLEYIDQYAFINTNIADVDIPESVTYIGTEAFYKDNNFTDPITKEKWEPKPLNSITINNPNCEIGEYIVPSGSDVIVYGHDGSTAQAFAEKNSNTFISLDAPVTTTTVATTTTTKATTVVTTNISPDKECVMVAVNDTIDEKTSANRILNSENLRFFDQNTADENGVVSFAYVPNNDEIWSFMFISEAVDNIVQKTFGAINDLQTVSETLVSDDDDTESLSTVSGDANGDGTVDMADAVLIMQALANPNKYGLNGTDPRHITENGLKYADTDGDGLTVNDAQHIQLYLLGKISSLG